MINRSRQPGLPLRAKPLPTSPAAELGLLSSPRGAGSAPGPHGAQRLRPGLAPGRLFHASLPDPATPLAAEAPRDPRSAARRSIRSAGTQRPGPRRGCVLQAPEGQCLGERPALFHPIPLTPPLRTCSPEAVERNQAAPPPHPHSPQPGTGRDAYHRRFTGEETGSERRGTLPRATQPWRQRIEIQTLKNALPAPAPPRPRPSEGARKPRK